MKRIPWLLIGLAWLWAPAVTAAPDPVARVLDRFCEASGGRERLAKLASISLAARVEVMDYQHTLHLLADGRFRNEGADRTTIYDGQKYWSVYYGVVQEATGNDLESLREISLNEIFLHGLFDAAGGPAKLQYAGSETSRGKPHELLTATRADGRKRTYYFDGATGLLTKIVELVPDPDLRELKNVYTFAEYQDCDGLQLPTAFQALCITTGDEIEPLTHFADIRVNQPVDERLFARPVSAVPPVELVDGWLVGRVVGLSGRGSLITSFTATDIARLGIQDPGELLAEVRGAQTRHRFTSDMQGVASGDYVATFNSSPLLWLVKAYVGMTSDQSYAVGDQVRLTAAGEGQEEAVR